MAEEGGEERGEGGEGGLIGDMEAVLQPCPPMAASTPPTKYTSEVRIPLLVAHVLGAVPGKNVPYGRSNCNYGSECRWPPL